MSDSPLDPQSFDAAFSVLETNAARLRNSSQMQIDDLLPIVEQSTAAYKICRDRLDRVRAALKQHLDGGTAGEAGLPASSPGISDPDFKVAASRNT